MALPTENDDGGEDLYGAPEIPDPEPFALPPEDPALPDSPDPLELMESVAQEMRAADAPDTPTTDVARDFEAIKRAGDSLAAADEAPAPAPAPAAAKEFAHTEFPRAAPPPADAGRPPRPDDGLPTNFADFLRQVNDMRRADGAPAHPNAKANTLRRWQQIQHDMGMEAEPGEEHIEIEAREAERAFYQQDKNRFDVMGNLLKLLTQTAIESQRRIAALEDQLLRSRS